MDGNLPPDQVAGRVDDLARASGWRWGCVGSACVALGAVMLLARFAIDLLALSCVLVFLAHSVRDTFLDWASGEAYPDELDPVWALWAVLASIAGTVLGLLWLVSTSSWAARTPVHDWLPPAVIQVATFAENRGWGRRVLLPHRHPGPIDSPPVARSEPPEAAAEPGHAQTPDRTSAATDAQRPADRPASTSGTVDPPRDPARAPAASGVTARTLTTLATSARAVRAGARLQLEARVTASSGQPRGPVVFRSGATVIGSAALDDRGVATLKLANLPVGTHEVTAEYPASPGFQRSRSATRAVVVTR